MNLETGAPVGSSEVAIVDRGASWCVAGDGRTRFSSSPRSPLLHNGVQERWPIDADAPWKSHGRPRRTARTEPSTAFSTELGKPANGCRFPTASTGRGAPSRGFARPLLFTTNGTYNRQQSDAGNTINPSTKSGQAQGLAFQAVRALDFLGRGSWARQEEC